MDSGPKGGQGADAAQFDDITLLVAVFTDGGYPGDDVLARHRYFDFLLFIVYCQLHLAVCTYRPIQVPPLAYLR